MSTLKNSVNINFFLQTLIKVIGRRSAQKLAIVTVDIIVHRPKGKYDFLKYVEINDKLYTEYTELIKIHPEIDNVERDNLRNAIDEIFDEVIRSLNQNIGYYFIKEIQGDIERELGSFFEEFEISLYLKQQMYQTVLKNIEKIKIQGINNSEVLKIIMNALFDLANNEELESFSIDNILNPLAILKEKHEFLRYIHIKDELDPYGHHEFNISPELDNFMSVERGKIIQELIVKICISTDLKTRQNFITNLKMNLIPRDLSKLEKIGVKLDNVDKALIKEGHEILITKILEVIIEIIETKASTSLAVEYIDTIIEQLQDKHEVLKYIKTDKTRYNDGMDAIEIMPEINSVDSPIFGRALQELLKKIQENTKEIAFTFLEDFKNKIGKEFLLEIEKIGVNFHILELRAI